MPKSREQRNFHRIFYQTEVLLSNATQQWPCTLIDISLHGCLLEFNQPWAAPDANNRYNLNLQLSDSIGIMMQVSISHIHGNIAGFKCVHIDLDSISTLRRLVELNLGDNALLERDLKALSL